MAASRSPLRRLGRVTASFAALLVGLTLLFALALFAVARTGFGDTLLTRFVPQLANPVLAEMGLGLELQEIQGPLPNRLRIVGLKLSDTHGIWLEAEAVEVRLRPLALLGKILDVEALETDTLHLYRLPELPPAPEEQASAETPPQPLAVLPKSFAVRLGRLELRQTLLGSALAGLPAEVAPALLSLIGKAQAAQTDRATATASLILDWPSSRSTALELSIDGTQYTASLSGTLRPVLDYLAPLLPQIRLQEHPDADVGLELALSAELPLLPPAAEGPLQANISANLSLADGKELDLGLPLSSRIAWDGKVLDLADLVLALREAGTDRLRLAGQAHLDDEALRTEVDLTVPDAQAVSGLVARLLPLLDESIGQSLRDALKLAPGGSLNLQAKLDGTPDLSRLVAELSTSGEGLDWPWPEADAAIGPKFSAAIRVNSPDLETWTIHEARIESTELSVNAAGDAVLTDPPRLAMGLDAHIGDLAVLTPLLNVDSGAPLVQGPLDVHLRADGKVSEPMTVTLAARSARLDFAVGPTRSASGLALNSTAVLDFSALTFDGGLNLQVESVQGAPLRASAKARGSQTDMHLELDAAFFGLETASSMRVRLPQEHPLLDGSASVTVRDWSFLRGLGLPLEADKFSVNVQASTSGDRQDAVADIQSATLRALNPVGDIDSLRANISARDVFGVPALDGQIHVGAGQMAGQSWEKGSITLSTDNALDLAAIRFAVKVDGDLAVSADGSYSPQQALLHLQSLELLAGEQELGVRLTRPVDVRHAPVLSFDTLDLALLPSGSLSLKGDLNSDALALDLQVREVPLAAARLVTQGIPDGMVNGTLAVRGTMRQPQGEGKLGVTELGLEGKSVPVTVQLQGSLQPQGGRSLARLEATLEGMGSRPGLLRAELPVSFVDGAPQVPGNTPLSGSLTWEGRLEDVWGFVPLPTMRLSGAGMIKASLEGTLDKPRCEASVYVGGGRFEELVQGVLLADIDLQATYSSWGQSVVRLRAGDGQKGVLAAAGTLDAHGDSPTLELKGAFDNLQPLQRDDLSLTLVGDFAVNGPLDDLQVVSQIIISQGEYRVIGNAGGSVPTLSNVEDPRQPAPAQASSEASAGVGSLDIRIRGDNRFFVRGRGLTSEWRTDLRLTGPLNEPSLVGRISPVRGSLEILSRNFQFEDGEVRFTGALLPSLDLGLVYTGPQITAVVKATGSATSPEINLSSDPPLPQDEIIAQVLFGKSFSQLSRLETVQAANATRDLASLAGSGGLGALGLMDLLRGDMGLDMLQLGSTPSGTAERQAGRDASVQSRAAAGEGSITTLEVGKYITNEVFLGVEQGVGTNNTSVRIEVDLRSNLSLDGRTDSSSSSVGLNWKRDY